MKKEITDKERTVLEIKFENGEKLYCASMSFQAVSNPENATRYPPLDDQYPERTESQNKDKAWMEREFDAEISYVPFLKACEDFKATYD